MARSATIYTGIRCRPVHSTWCRDIALDILILAALKGCECSSEGLLNLEQLGRI